MTVLSDAAPSLFLMGTVALYSVIVYRWRVTQYSNCITQYTQYVTQYAQYVTQYTQYVTQYTQYVTQYAQYVTQYAQYSSAILNTMNTVTVLSNEPPSRFLMGTVALYSVTQYTQYSLIERTPPPEGVSYLLCSLIKNRV